MKTERMNGLTEKAFMVLVAIDPSRAKSMFDHRLSVEYETIAEYAAAYQWLEQKCTKLYYFEQSERNAALRHIIWFEDSRDMIHFTLAHSK